MSVYLLSTRPRIGGELENVEAILHALEAHKDAKEVLCIVSHFAIMGPRSEFYSELSDFYPRQMQALKRIQEQIGKNQTLICALFSQDLGVYQPAAINRQGISLFENVYSFQENQKTFQIFCIAGPNFPTPLTTEENDIVVNLWSEPFASCPKDFMEISLSQRYSVRAMEKHLREEVFNKSIYLSVPVHAQYHGCMYDGSFYYRNQSFISLPDQLIPLDPESFKPLNKTWGSQLMMERIFTLLCHHIRFYIEDLGAQGVVVALSGGMDSALVATLSVKALGPERVLGLLMPGPFSSSHSMSDSQALCQNLGIRHEIRSINTLYQESQKVLEPMSFHSLSLENLQARLRGLLLMTYSNELGMPVLNTSNKSEAMVGYATLYGDSVGAFSPIGDLYKTEVYELAKYINMRFQKELIPASILDKAPSAELREDQKDTDSLPPYNTLDKFLQAVVEYHQDAEKIGSILGFSEETRKDLLHRIFSSQYKRKQSPRAFLLKEEQGVLQMEKWSEHQNWI